MNTRKVKELIITKAQAKTNMTIWNIRIIQMFVIFPLNSRLKNKGSYFDISPDKKRLKAAGSIKRCYCLLWYQDRYWDT